MQMNTALTIAGSDSSGGAGIQADLKTMTACGVFAMSAITALTAQNTTGVRGVLGVDPQFLALQIDAVFEDIPPDAVKIGMVADPDTAAAIADRLSHWNAANIVVDPVAVATSGSALSTSDAYEAVKKLLFPMAAVITPNIPEAQLISGLNISSDKDMEKAAGSGSLLRSFFSALCSVRAVTASAMLMMSSPILTEISAGSTVSASITQIPTVLAAPCQAL